MCSASRVAVVTISDELPGVAATYFQHWDISLPIVEDVQGAIFRIYSVSKIPVTLVLDRPGGGYVRLGGRPKLERASGGNRAGAS